MNTELLIDRIIDIGCRRKHPKATKYFAQTSFAREDIASACARIWNWLCAKAISLKMRPAQLDLSRRSDILCQALIEENVYLQQILQVEGIYLSFAQHLSFAQMKEIALWAKTKYEPLVIE